MEIGYCTHLAAILRKAQGVVDPETKTPIDVGEECVALRRAFDAMCAERDALRKDAERYRWIIKHMRLGIGQNGAYWSLTDATQVAPNHIGEVDATIDAALRGEE